MKGLESWCNDLHRRVMRILKRSDTGEKQVYREFKESTCAVTEIE